MLVVVVEHPDVVEEAEEGEGQWDGDYVCS